MLTLILERHEDRQMSFTEAGRLIEAAAALRYPKGTVAWYRTVQRLDRMFQGGDVYDADDEERTFVETLSLLLN